MVHSLLRIKKSHSESRMMIDVSSKRNQRHRMRGMTRIVWLFAVIIEFNVPDAGHRWSPTVWLCNRTIYKRILSVRTIVSPTECTKWKYSISIPMAKIKQMGVSHRITAIPFENDVRRLFYSCRKTFPAEKHPRDDSRDSTESYTGRVRPARGSIHNHDAHLPCKPWHVGMAIVVKWLIGCTWRDILRLIFIMTCPCSQCPSPTRMTDISPGGVLNINQLKTSVGLIERCKNADNETPGLEIAVTCMTV